MENTKVEAGDCQRYRLNDPAVIADIIDGEAVIMNLASGSYYSLDRLGSEIWRLLIAGLTPTEIADAVAKQYGIERERTAHDVGRLAAQMIDEKLIVTVTQAAGQEQAISATRFAAAIYAPPVLSVYSDMRDLLALDPPLPDFKTPSDR